jgi:poly(hydroxyalkanoate) granule-associated protein
VDPFVTTEKEMKMGKKLKELAGGVRENQLAATVKESAQQIWLAGLGAFAKAQEEGGKVFDALVKEGAIIQAKSRKVTDEKIAEVAGKAAGTWDRLEQVFENRVARALGSLGVPSKQEIDRLSKRVAKLSAAVQALTEGIPVATKHTADPAAGDEMATEKAAAHKVPAGRPLARKAAAKPAATKPAATKPAATKPAAAKPAATKPVPPVTPADVLHTLPHASE